MLPLFFSNRTFPELEWACWLLKNNLETPRELRFSRKTNFGQGLGEGCAANDRQCSTSLLRLVANQLTQMCQSHLVDRRKNAKSRDVATVRAATFSLQHRVHPTARMNVWFWGMRMAKLSGMYIHKKPSDRRDQCLVPDEADFS